MIRPRAAGFLPANAPVATLCEMAKELSLNGRRPSRTKLTALVAMALVVATFIAYRPVWQAGFIWDDDDHLTANPAMTAPHGLRMIWSSLTISRYYPLTLTTFWFERRLWGLNPLPYHLVNVALHAINGILVFLLLRRLRVPVPWLAATLWVLHPVNVESVAWITELKNTQSGFFFLLALLCFLRFEKEGRRRWYALFLLCGVGAMLSKPSTVVLPAVLLLCAWWDRGRWQRSDLVRVAPVFGLAFGMSVLTVVEQHGHIVKAGMAEWTLTVPERLVIAGKAVCFYAAKLVWPSKLVFVYPRWEIRTETMFSWLPVAGLIAGSIVLLKWRRQSWARAGLFGLGGFVLGLLPVLGIFDVYYFRYSFVADHFQYLPSVALIAWLTGVAAQLCECAGRPGRQIGVLVGASVLVVLGGLSWRQAGVYRDLDTLWRDTLEKNPGCWMAQNNMGDTLFKNGKVQESIGHYEQALRINPELAVVHYNLANALRQANRLSEAIGHYEWALQIRPSYPEAHSNLGGTLQQMGKTADAIQEYRQALRIEPGLGSVHDSLGNALVQAGRVEEAIREYEQALRINPDSAETHNNFGAALFLVGQVQPAIGQYEQALRLKSDYAEARTNLAAAHYQLGNTLLQAGRVEDATQHYEHALRNNPGMAPAHYGLGNIFFQSGKLDDACRHYEQALKINPNDVEVWFNLGLALIKDGKPQAAVRCYEEAARLKPDYLRAQNNLARLLAMLPPTQGGNAARAVTLAQRVNEQTGGKEMAYEDTLAIAYAAAGRFDDAVTAAQKAIELARAGQPQWISELEARLDLYREGRAYRQFTGVNESSNP